MDPHRRARGSGEERIEEAGAGRGNNHQERVEPGVVDKDESGAGLATVKALRITFLPRRKTA